jgi:phasin family protein
MAGRQLQHELIGVKSLHPTPSDRALTIFAAPQQKGLAKLQRVPILRFMLHRSKAFPGAFLPNAGAFRMSFTAEQLIAAQKSNLETLFGLTAKAFEGVEKLVELNLQVAKTALEEASETAKSALSVKDAQELVALQAGLLQPAAEKAAAYGRHLYDIASSTSAEVGKVTESKFAEAQSKLLAVVDTAVKNAPAGSENAVALVKSAVAAASNAFESVQKAAKQAADVAEANFQAVSTSAVKAASQAAAAAPKVSKRAATV